MEICAFLSAIQLLMLFHICYPIPEGSIHQCQEYIEPTQLFWMATVRPGKPRDDSFFLSSFFFFSFLFLFLFK